MTEIALKWAASFRNDELEESRPLVALEHLENWTGRLVARCDISVTTADQTGICAVNPGDVLFGKLRPYLAKGLTVTEPMAASTELICMRPAAHTDSRWLGYVTRSVPFVEWSVASSEGTKMPRTSWEKLREFTVTLPPLREQRAIANYLDTETARIDALITKKRRMIELLEERELSLIDVQFGPSAGDRLVRLGRSARVQTGVTVSASRAPGPTDIEVSYLRVANVQHGGLQLDEIKSISIPVGMVSRSLLQIGDVLMTEGGDIDKLGRGTVWGGEIEGCVHQNHVFAVRVDRSKLIPDFLANVTRTSHARAYFESTGVQSTNLASTSATKVADFRMPLPDVHRQRQTCAKFASERSRLLETRERLERQVALLAEHRQALITAAVTGELSIPKAA